GIHTARMMAARGDRLFLSVVARFVLLLNGEPRSRRQSAAVARRGAGYRNVVGGIQFVRPQTSVQASNRVRIRTIGWIPTSEYLSSQRRVGVRQRPRPAREVLRSRLRNDEYFRHHQRVR